MFRINKRGEIIMKKLSLLKSLLAVSALILGLTACEKHENKVLKEVQIEENLDNKHTIDPFEEVDEIEIDVVPVDEVQVKKTDEAANTIETNKQ